MRLSSQVAGDPPPPPLRHTFIMTKYLTNHERVFAVPLFSVRARPPVWNSIGPTQIRLCDRLR